MNQEQLQLELPGTYFNNKTTGHSCLMQSALLFFFLHNLAFTFTLRFFRISLL